MGARDLSPRGSSVTKKFSDKFIETAQVAGMILLIGLMVVIFETISGSCLNKAAHPQPFPREGRASNKMKYIYLALLIHLLSV